MIRLRNYFITGAAVLVPLVLTWYVLAALFRFLDGLTARWVAEWFGYQIPGLGLLVTAGIVLLTGLLTRSYVGRKLLEFSQNLMSRVPVVRGVYTTIRQVVDAVALPSRDAFKRVVLVEYPRREIWSIAFLTATSIPSVSEAVGGEMIAVFMPTTPNPTSGYMLMLPRRDVRFIDMSVEDGLKLVISAGVYVPSKAVAEPEPPAEAPEAEGGQPR